MWVWVLVVGGVMAFLFVGALAVIGFANRQWERERARQATEPPDLQQPWSADPPS